MRWGDKPLQMGLIDGYGMYQVPYYKYLKMFMYTVTDWNVLFVCGSFNDDVCSSDYIVSNDEIVNELVRMWKEAVGPNL